MIAAVLVPTACGSASGPGSAVRTARAEFVLPAAASSADAGLVADRMAARFHALGVGDVDVTAHGHTILVTGDPRVSAVAPLVAGRGELTFRPVVAVYPKGIGVPQPPPAGVTILPARDRHGADHGDLLGVAAPVITGGVVGATASNGSSGNGWVVDVRFRRDAGRAFDRLATASIDLPPPRNEVAIVVDDVVQSAPAFQSDSFPDGVQISGAFTAREARALAAAFHTGAYPVAVRLRR